MPKNNLRVFHYIANSLIFLLSDICFQHPPPIRSNAMMNKDKSLLEKIENYRAWDQPCQVLGNGKG